MHQAYLSSANICQYISFLLDLTHSTKRKIKLQTKKSNIRNSLKNYLKSISSF